MIYLSDSRLVLHLKEGAVEVSDVKNLQDGRKNVRWEVDVTASPKSGKSLEKADRTQKKRKTLHTWRRGF